MTAYYEEVRSLQEKFDGIELHHILRHDNEVADFLTKLASSREPDHRGSSSTMRKSRRSNATHRPTGQWVGMRPTKHPCRPPGPSMGSTQAGG
jgi:2-polyprenyl-3-methyl-5-hydroxy-6-metoxy-1,4-benzoquinol methylase